MNTMAVLATAALAFAVVTLAQGIRSMAHGGEEDDRDSTLLMLRRCAWQAGAFGFILLAMLTRSGG